MTKTEQQIKDEYVRLFVRDVQEMPDAYKESVRLNAELTARERMAGLNRDEAMQFLRELRAERRMVGLSNA